MKPHTISYSPKNLYNVIFELTIMESVNTKLIHEENWQKVINEAKTDKYFKYGIYCSRSLAVKHPEIYLLADMRFFEHISNNPGFKRAYEIKDIHSRDLYGPSFPMWMERSPPFTFEDVEFEKFLLSNTKELYPKDYPFLPFFDRRVLPIQSTLKTTNNTITELEKAILLYIKNKEINEENLTYIIYCDNEKAYLWNDEKIIGVSNEEKITGNPILIFNEKNVWYPTMNRDDTDIDNKLKELVEIYSNENRMPHMIEIELRLLEAIIDVTSLKNENQKKMAIIVSGRIGGFLGTHLNSQFSDKPWLKYQSLWKDILPKRSSYHNLLGSIIMRGNLLSPVTSYLAELAANSDGLDKLGKVSKEWVRRTRTPMWTKTRGHLWRCALIEFTTDEILRTGAGHCLAQSWQMSAVLEVAGIEHIVYNGAAPPPNRRNHHYIYVPEFEFVIDDGRLQSAQGSITLDERNRLDIACAIYHNGKFARLQLGDYGGSFSPDEALKELEWIMTLTDDELRIYEPRTPFKVPTTTKDIYRLKNEYWEPWELP